jgi:hypothetical protein
METNGVGAECSYCPVQLSSSAVWYIPLGRGIYDELLRYHNQHYDENPLCAYIVIYAVITNFVFTLQGSSFRL